MAKLLLQVLVGNISTKVDGSIKITLETMELNNDDAAALFGLRGAEAYALLSANKISEEDAKLPTEKADPAIGTKTPSQRLRNVLYRLWQQQSGGTDFESYYRVKMEQLIESIKAKLD